MSIRTVFFFRLKVFPTGKHSFGLAIQWNKKEITLIYFQLNIKSSINFVAQIPKSSNKLKTKKEKKLNKFERKMNIIFLTNNGKLFEWWWFCDCSGQLIWFNWNQVKTVQNHVIRIVWYVCQYNTVSAVSYTYRARFSVVSLLTCVKNAECWRKEEKQTTPNQYTTYKSAAYGKRESMSERVLWMVGSMTVKFGRFTAYYWWYFYVICACAHCMHNTSFRYL